MERRVLQPGWRQVRPLPNDLDGRSPPLNAWPPSDRSLIFTYNARQLRSFPPCSPTKHHLGPLLFAERFLLLLFTERLCNAPAERSGHLVAALGADQGLQLRL